MELNYLRYFYEVAKAGSFTGAARKLHISQSALSKSVGLLEEHEGVKLLERSKKGVTLTALGTEVFLQSERIFQTVMEIELTCRGKKQICEGPLSFGASDHVVNYLLVPNLQQLRRTYPKLTPSIFAGTPNDMIEKILSNEIEFGLFFTKINVPGIQYQSLFSVEMAAVCHPDLLVDGKSTPLKTVIQKSGFIASIRAQYQNHPSKDLMKLLDQDPHITFESNSQETQKRLCIHGAGVAYLARFMVEKELKSGQLKEIPLSKPTSIPLVLATRKGRDLSLNAQTFLRLLVQKDIF